MDLMRGLKGIGVIKGSVSLKGLLKPHWSKLTLIPFLILRTFDHSSRWEMIKEF